ncbi:hypothetical protein C7N83_12865 [Neisseria iguanae]|uniref:Uncharacterized protein n=1 Tax=Neisseria iguanae TaxID=90242 RepID=A0A2P7TX65_9NEIS|nr:hypothetical protein C7N83_12865 [Neisseria iguanae]
MKQIYLKLKHLQLSNKAKITPRIPEQVLIGSKKSMRKNTSNKKDVYISDGLYQFLANRV